MKLQPILLLALLTNIAGCGVDTGVVFGDVAPITTCHGGGGSSSGTGGAGGSAAGAGGSTTSSSTTTTTSEGGSTTTSSTSSTTSSTSSTTELTCQEKACIDWPFECGPTQYDCDGNGQNEVYMCGTCAAPAVCRGSEIPFECGSKCYSEYCAICAGKGLPTGLCPVAGCSLAYKWEPNGDLLFVDGIANLDCVNTTAANGVAIQCCPWP